ncbi:hypothetical protein [Clostridium sp.]|uniref:hypothetical protein n=1 Tax=Clostridium sp. TaxID=1506 RepID=UPI0026223C0C|nr:hypothetical protein [uncultured Clostridium sp.]
MHSCYIIYTSFIGFGEGVLQRMPFSFCDDLKQNIKLGKKSVKDLINKIKSLE